jgi:hypothetical protein
MSLSVAPGAGKGNDQMFQHGGKQVLRIAGAVSQRLNGSTMDVVVEEEPEGTRMGIGIMTPDPEPLTEEPYPLDIREKPLDTGSCTITV